MIRPSASSRRFIGLGIALTVGTGIGLGAYSLGSAAGTDTVYFPRAGSAASTASATSAHGHRLPDIGRGVRRHAVDPRPGDGGRGRRPLPVASSSGTRTTSRRACGTT